MAERVRHPRVERYTPLPGGSGIMPPALRPAREVHRCDRTGGACGTVRSLMPPLGKPGPTLNLRDESPVGENRKWNAGRRARPQAEGGASRLTPWRVPHAACVRASNPCVCRRSASFYFLPGASR
jgi:hypothetical protein